MKKDNEIIFIYIFPETVIDIFAKYYQCQNLCFCSCISATTLQEIDTDDEYSLNSPNVWKNYLPSSQ